MIRKCCDSDFEMIYSIVNDAAQAYKGVIPVDRWNDEYMTKSELLDEIESGVEFWGFKESGELIGVMGLQHVQDVTLIRHAYVRTIQRNKGIGGKLLEHLRSLIDKPILMGTWADAHWAIRFYEKNGFVLVSKEEKERLLRKYWNIPERQIETSVVLKERSRVNYGNLQKEALLEVER